MKIRIALAIALLAGCSGNDNPRTAPGVSPPATGGSAPGTGGTGGVLPPTGTGGSTGGSGGTTTTGGVGGSITTGGTADSGRMPDAPMSMLDGSVGDASSDDGGYNPGGDPWPAGGRPYIHLCKPEWSQTQCCQFLCDCVDHLCTDSPQDAKFIPNCMTMCSKLSPARARCQVYHCFESKSPTAVADHASHCGHATGRVGGGSCTGVP
jgi:hypothetical protein